MDAYIRKALELYAKENHGREVSGYVRDTISWLIRHKAEEAGMDTVEQYIEDGQLWKDLINRLSPE